MSWSKVIAKRIDDLVAATPVSTVLVNHLISKDVINREQSDTLLNNFWTDTAKSNFLYNNIAARLTETQVRDFKDALRASLCARAIEILEKEQATYSDVTDSKSTEESYASGKNFALIINILTDRPGAEMDNPELMDTLQGCGFEISICDNWTKEGVETAITEFKIKLKAVGAKKIGSVLIVVASHGKAGDVFVSSDKKKLNLDANVIDQFNEANCEVLNGIPKVFLVNICRGNREDIPAAERIDADDEELSESFASSFEAWWESKTGEDYDESRGCKPTWCELLVGYASYDGHKAYRSAITGTVFLQAFCNVVRTQAKGKPMCIKKLLEKVSDKINEDRTHRRKKQAPQTKNTGFTKSLPFQYR